MTLVSVGFCVDAFGLFPVPNVFLSFAVICYCRFHEKLVLFLILFIFHLFLFHILFDVLFFVCLVKVGITFEGETFMLFYSISSLGYN